MTSLMNIKLKMRNITAIYHTNAVCVTTLTGSDDIGRIEYTANFESGDEQAGDYVT